MLSRNEFSVWTVLKQCIGKVRYSSSETLWLFHLPVRVTLLLTIQDRIRFFCVAYTKCLAILWHNRIYYVAYTKVCSHVMARSDLSCGLHNVCSHIMARSDLFICPREASACHVATHTCTHCGSIIFLLVLCHYAVGLSKIISRIHCILCFCVWHLRFGAG